MPTLQHTLYFAWGFIFTHQQRQQWGVRESPSDVFVGSTFNTPLFWGLYGNSKYADSMSRIWGPIGGRRGFDSEGVAIFTQEHWASLSSVQWKYVAMTQAFDWPGIEGQDFASSAQLVYDNQFNKILLPEPRSLSVISPPVYRGFDERMAGHYWSMEVEVTTTDWLPFSAGFNPLGSDTDPIPGTYYTSPGNIYNVVVCMSGSRPAPDSTGQIEFSAYFVGGVDYPFGDFDYVRPIPGSTSVSWPASYDSPLVDIEVQSVKRVYNGFEIKAKANTVTGPLAGGVAFIGWQVFADTGSSIPNKEGLLGGPYLQHSNNVGSTGRSWRDKGYWQGGTYIATGEEVTFIIPYEGRYRIRAVVIDNRGYVGSYQLPENFDPNSIGWPGNSSSRTASERPIVLFENPVPIHYDKNSSSLEIIWKDKTTSPNPVYTAKAKTLTSPLGDVRPLAWYGNPNSTLLNDQPIDFLHGKDYRLYLPRYSLNTGVAIPSSDNFFLHRQVGEGSDTGPYQGRVVMDHYSSVGLQGNQQAFFGTQNTADKGCVGIALDISPDGSTLYALRHIYALPPLVSYDFLANQRHDYIAFTKIIRGKSRNSYFREWENLPAPFESLGVAGHLVTGLDGLRPPCKMFNYPWGFFLFGQRDNGVVFAQANNEGKDWTGYTLYSEHLLIGAAKSDDNSYLFAVTIDPEGAPFVTRAKLVRTEWVFEEKEPCEGLPEYISYPGSMVYAAGYLRLVFHSEDTLRHAYSADNGRTWTVTE